MNIYIYTLTYTSLHMYKIGPIQLYTYTYKHLLTDAYTNTSIGKSKSQKYTHLHTKNTPRC